MVQRLFSSLVVSMILFAGAVNPAERSGDAATDRVVKVEGIRDLFQTGDFYIGGQPNLETLRWLKSQGVTVVVNLRLENENRDFATASFNEENMVKELGLAYSPIPIGDKDSYSPKSLEKFAQAINAGSGKTLLHCATGVRATYMWMAYLVRYRGHSLNDAVTIGKQMRFTLPVEDFLGSRVSMTVEDLKK